MSGDVIKEFLVGLGFQIDDAGMANFTKGIGTATLAVTAIGVAAVGAAGLITKFVTGVAEEFDKVSDLAGKVGATADEILRMNYIASQTDSSAEAVASSLEGLSRTAGEAALGVGRGAKMFEEFGIQANDSNGKLKSTSSLMAEIGDKIKGMEKGKQLAILSKLGIDPTMVQQMTTDVSALKDEFDSMYKVAGINAEDAAQASSDFMDSVGKLQFVMDTTRKAVGLKFMGQLKVGIDSLRKFLVENMPKIIAAITPIISLVLRIAEAFIAIAGRVGSIISGIVERFNELNGATNGWAGYILAAAAAWKFLNLSFLATPIGMILALAAAIALLVEDFLTWKEGGDSLIDWGKWKNEIELVTDLVNGFKNVLTDVFTAIFAAIDSVVSLLTGDWAGAWFAVKELASSIAGIFSGGSKTGLTPSPQAAASMTAGAQTVSQKTEIVVQGSANPEATARAVAAQQSRVNGDMARSTRGAAR
jgi:hypothetical protein